MEVGETAEYKKAPSRTRVPGGNNEPLFYSNKPEMTFLAKDATWPFAKVFSTQFREN